MILDNVLFFSDAQEIASTEASDNVIDFGKTNPNLGDGTPLVIHFIVEEDFDSAADTGTLTIALQEGATSTPATTICTSPAYTVAQLAQGAYIREMIIPKKHLRYMRLYYTVGTENFTKGKLTATIPLIN